MPIPAVNIAQTNPKEATFQFSADRMSGLTLKLQSGVTSVTNRRIVSVQQDALGNLYAVPGLKVYQADEYTDPLTIVGVGVLEEALQSGGIGSIAPSPNTFVDGDQVTVLNCLSDIYQIDYDSSNVPANGIASCRVNNAGQLTSVAADADNIQINGSVFTGKPGVQMTNQLLQYCKFYKLKDAVVA